MSHEAIICHSITCSTKQIFFRNWNDFFLVCFFSPSAWLSVVTHLAAWSRCVDGPTRSSGATRSTLSTMTMPSSSQGKILVPQVCKVLYFSRSRTVQTECWYLLPFRKGLASGLAQVRPMETWKRTLRRRSKSQFRSSWPYQRGIIFPKPCWHDIDAPPGFERNWDCWSFFGM